MDKRFIIFIIALTGGMFFVNQWFGSKNTAPQSAIVEERQPHRSAAQEPLQERQQLQESNKETEEKFFVLENNYLQLVFSNKGGALAEINLPFQSKENPKSVIREISFDRAMEKENPNNDTFPLFPYYKNTSLQNLNPGVLGGYYPLLRRSIVGGVRKKTLFEMPSSSYALNLPSQDEESADTYTLKRFEKNLIEFEASLPHRRIVKTFSLPDAPDEAPYCFNLSIKIEGDARGLSLSSGVPEVELISGNPSPTLKYRLTRNQKAVVEQIDLPKAVTTITSVVPDWICNSNGFLGLIIDPLTDTGSGVTAVHLNGEDVKTRLTLIDSKYDLYPAQKYPGYELRLPLRPSNQAMQFRVFAGPFSNDILKKVDAAYADPKTGNNPDYIACQSFHGWFSFISEPFAKFLFILMKLFYKISHSWGVSIILLTVALRIMLYPLNAWSIKSTARMQQIAPQVTAIQEKYKKDPKRAQIEVMSLYREKGVNPLTGCFPLLIQMPFLIGMFDLLKSTFELRGVSFIPGWIDNLTAPDVVFTWGYPIIFFGTSFHFLPILLGLVMYFQQKFSTSAPKDVKLMTDQQKQQRMMGNIMVIVFAVMFYHFPSGLNIYWLSSMLLGILQQWITTKRVVAAKPLIKAK